MKDINRNPPTGYSKRSWVVLPLLACVVANSYTAPIRGAQDLEDAQDGKKIMTLISDFLASKKSSLNDPNRTELLQTDEFVAFMRQHGVQYQVQKPMVVTPDLMRQVRPITTDEEMARLQATLSAQNNLTSLTPGDPHFLKQLPSLSPWRFASFLNFGGKSAPVPNRAILSIPDRLQHLVAKQPRYSLANIQDMPSAVLDSVVLLELKRNEQGTYCVPADQLEQAKATGKIVIATFGGQPTCPL